MKLILADPTILKDSISVISDLVNEARFKITRDGLELIAMDPANVAIVIFKLLSSSFAEYDVEKEQEIAVNLANFKQILRQVGASDILTLEVSTDNKLHIQLKGGTTRPFSLPLIELEEKEQRIPNLTFPVAIRLDSSVFSDAIRRAAQTSETVLFSVKHYKKFMIFYSEEFTISVPNQPSTIYQTREHVNSEIDKVSARYSIEYLEKMVNAEKLANEVSIFFNQDYPLKLEYKIVDKLLLSFILAPRVEND